MQVLGFCCYCWFGGHTPQHLWSVLNDHSWVVHGGVYKPGLKSGLLRVCKASTLPPMLSAGAHFKNSSAANNWTAWIK